MVHRVLTPLQFRHQRSRLVDPTQEVGGSHAGGDPAPTIVVGAVIMGRLGGPVRITEQQYRVVMVLRETILDVTVEGVCSPIV